MENLREVGNRYNALCDSIDGLKEERKQCRDKETRADITSRLAQKKQELKDFRNALTGDERQAFQDYRAIRREIKRCETLKKCDKVERKVFRVINPAYIYMIPAGFGAVFFTLLPFLFMIVGAFFKLDLVDIQNSKFVGLWTFDMIFTRDDEFWRAFVNTISFAVLTVFLLMIITILMSSWLSKNTKIHNLSQTMIFTPHIAHSANPP